MDIQSEWQKWHKGLVGDIKNTFYKVLALTKKCTVYEKGLWLAVNGYCKLKGSLEVTKKCKKEKKER